MGRGKVQGCWGKLALCEMLTLFAPLSGQVIDNNAYVVKGLQEVDYFPQGGPYVTQRAIIGDWSPAALAVSNDDSIYVAGSHSSFGYVYYIPPSATFPYTISESNKVVSLGAGSNPMSLSILPSGTQGFFGDSLKKTLYSFPTTGESVTATPLVTGVPSQGSIYSAISSNGNTLFLSVTNLNTVYSLPTTTSAPVNISTLPVIAQFTSGPTDNLANLACSSNGEVYIAATQSGRIYRFSVNASHVDLSVATPAAQFPSGELPVNIQFSSDGSNVFVSTNNGHVYSFAASHLSEGATYQVLVTDKLSSITGEGLATQQRASSSSTPTPTYTSTGTAVATFQTQLTTATLSGLVATMTALSNSTNTFQATSPFVYTKKLTVVNKQQCSLCA